MRKFILSIIAIIFISFSLSAQIPMQVRVRDHSGEKVDCLIQINSLSGKDHIVCKAEKADSALFDRLIYSDGEYSLFVVFGRNSKSKVNYLSNETKFDICGKESMIRVAVSYERPSMTTWCQGYTSSRRHGTLIIQRCYSSEIRKEVSLPGCKNTHGSDWDVIVDNIFL